MTTPETILDALRRVQDPYLMADIVDLGLVYDVRLAPGSAVNVDLTLTTRHHPRAGEIVQAATQAIRSTPGVADAQVRLVWDPPWTPYRMAGHLKAPLGLPADEPAPPGPAPSETAARRLFRRLVQR